jgi:hypothetical protein
MGGNASHVHGRVVCGARFWGDMQQKYKFPNTDISQVTYLCYDPRNQVLPSIRKNIQNCAVSDK